MSGGYTPQINGEWMTGNATGPHRIELAQTTEVGPDGQNVLALRTTFADASHMIPVTPSALASFVNDAKEGAYGQLINS